MEQKPGSPKERRRMTLQLAREEAKRAAIEAWAWEALYSTLKRIVETTGRGILL